MRFFLLVTPVLCLVMACGGSSDGDGASGGAGGSSGGSGSGGGAGTSGSGGGDAGSLPVPSFKRIQLESQFYAEGATYGDFDQDGDGDVVAGPFWYEGPDFSTKHELYTPSPFDPKGYSDNFFAWTRDFNADGYPDVLVVGFPNKDASWYENPKGQAGHWTRHLVVPAVDNESPTFVDITGDGVPELVHGAGGRYGWSAPGADPTQPWAFTPLSPPADVAPFTHGMGVGDINGDQRADLLTATGSWLQPESLTGALWTFQPYVFGSGGAQMFARDVDADGDVDVIATLAAHGYGVAWFERQAGAQVDFEEHVFSGADLGAAPAPVLHEPHALTLADMNGDGVEDIVTGERFWGHVPGGDPDFNAPALLLWFEVRRESGGVQLVPHTIDDASGVGTQVVAGDIDGDQRSDVVIANKKGVFVFLQEAP